MTRLRHLADRFRRSRAAAAVSAGLVALVLAFAGPSLLSALGSFSGPVGCFSGPDFTDDFTDDFTVEPVGEGSHPCPGSSPDGGGDDSGGAGGEPVSDLDDSGVVSATPTFTG